MIYGEVISKNTHPVTSSTCSGHVGSGSAPDLCTEIPKIPPPPLMTRDSAPHSTMPEICIRIKMRVLAQTDAYEGRCASISLSFVVLNCRYNVVYFNFFRLMFGWFPSLSLCLLFGLFLFAAETNRTIHLMTSAHYFIPLTCRPTFDKFPSNCIFNRLVTQLRYFFCYVTLHARACVYYPFLLRSTSHDFSGITANSQLRISQSECLETTATQLHS